MSKLRSADSGADAEASASFEITCACGRVYEGTRSEADQVVECNHCGRRLFVLPRSPYPEVPAADPAEPATPPHRKSWRKRKKEPPAIEETVPDERPTSSATDEKVSAAEVEPLTLPSRRRLVTPLRLIVAVMVGLFCATGYWQYQRSVQSRAEREFREHADNGYEALKRSDFPKAYDKFRLAVAALDRLPRDDAKARHVRQMFRESMAVSDLISKSLPEILEEAHRLRQNDAKEWRRNLQRSYTGHWVVLDTVVRKNELNPETALAFDYPLIVEGRVVLFTGRPAVFEQLTDSKTSQRVILAIEIESFDISDDERNWIVRINPDSAFLWCDYKNFRALGFDFATDADEDVPGEIDTERELRALLTAQSRTMGVTE